MRLVLAAAFGVSFGLGLVLVLVVRALAHRWSFLDHPGGRKGHPRAVPLGGGVAIALASGLPLLAVGLAAHAWMRNPGLFRVPPALEANMALAAQRFPLLLKLLAGGAALVALGLWDDIAKLGPWRKLAGQFAVAIAVSLIPEARITLFVPSPVVQVAVTTLWIMLLVNGFNLLDNMDGQSGLVAFLTGGALVVLALQTGQVFLAGMLLALMGAVLAFLVFNLPPATIFMGDAGAMFLGYVLAVATALCSFVTVQHTNPLFPVVLPLVIFAVPLYDTLSVLAIRLDSGQPLMRGDRNHFAHRLLRLGLSERMVLLTIGLMVLATAPGATIPYGSSTWRVFVPAFQAGAVVCVIIILEVASARLKTWRGSASPEGEGESGS